MLSRLIYTPRLTCTEDLVYCQKIYRLSHNHDNLPEDLSSIMSNSRPAFLYAACASNRRTTSGFPSAFACLSAFLYALQQWHRRGSFTCLSGDGSVDRPVFLCFFRCAVSFSGPSFFLCFVRCTVTFSGPFVFLRFVRCAVSFSGTTVFLRVSRCTDAPAFGLAIRVAFFSVLRLSQQFA